MQITPQRSFLDIAKSSSEDKSITHCVVTRGCGDTSEDAECGAMFRVDGVPQGGARDGLSLSSGQFGVWGEEDSLLLSTA